VLLTKFIFFFLGQVKDQKTFIHLQPVFIYLPYQIEIEIIKYY